MEDEPTTVLAVSRLLKRNGWESVQTSGLRAALEALRVRTPDLVLLDYHLSDGLGWPVLERANSIHPPIPVIVLTGAGDENIASQALRSGAADYLVKRGNYLQELPRSIERVLEIVRMKRNILELEERQSRLLASLPVMVALVEPDGRIAFVNHAWRELVNWLRARASEAFSAPDHPLKFPAVAEGLDSVQVGKRRRFEARYHYSYGGVERHFKVLVSPVAKSEAVLTLLDITEEVAKEQEIARLAGAVEQSQDLILITTPDWIIEYINPAFEAVYGCQLSELKGQWVKVLCSEQNRPEVYREIRETLATGSPWFGRLNHLDRTGELKHLDTAVGVIRAREGSAVHHVVVLRDVTRQVYLEDQLLQAQKMEAVGRLAGGIAHDFNNLLTVISGAATFLQAELDSGSSAQTDLNDILKATESAAGLTRQLLSFARLQVVQPKPLDLNSQVKSLTKLLGRILRETVDVQVALHPGVLPIEADPYQIEQVLLNLAVNASDAMQGGGLLSVSTSLKEVTNEEADLPMGRYACVSVKDTGVGIPEENLKQIFEPFFTTKPVGVGTGLGLSSVYGIAQQHGGGVRVQSKVGTGSEFTVLFPTSTEVANAAPTEGERPPTDDSPKPALVLVVEDNHGVRRIVVRSLEKQGYEVEAFEAAEGVLGLGLERLEKFDLFLSDVILPGLAGPDLAKQLRRRGVTAPFVFMSGYSEPGEVKDALALGAAYIKKPFATNELLQTVAEVLQAEAQAGSPRRRSP